jgi:hypothetical protein
MKPTEAEVLGTAGWPRGGGGGGGGWVAAGWCGPGHPAGNKWWLEYDIATGNVVLNDKYEPEPTAPAWAQVSPDKQTILFARGQNLFMMDAKNYAIAQKTPNDPLLSSRCSSQRTAMVATRPRRWGRTMSRIRSSSGGRGGQQTGQVRRRPHANDKKFGPRRRSVGVSWSQDHKKFSLQRTDSRKVGDLWVINSLANPRPRLETYKYGMPGEANQPQAELHVLTSPARKPVKLLTEAFRIRTWEQRRCRSPPAARKGMAPRRLTPAGDR